VLLFERRGEARHPFEPPGVNVHQRQFVQPEAVLAGDEAPHQERSPHPARAQYRNFHALNISITQKSACYNPVSEVAMTTLTLSDILDDLQAAEEGLHKFERRFWISSEDFYELYSRGLLDDGENAESFAEWAGHYKLKQKRQHALEQISKQRLEVLRQQADPKPIRLVPAEPAIPLA
jgi:hypothetical protein